MTACRRWSPTASRIPTVVPRRWDAPDRPVARHRAGCKRLARTGTPRCSSSTRRRRCSADGRARSRRTNPATLDLEKIAASGPTKDTSIPNLSSIAVLAEFGGRAVLLTGDAHADVLAASIAALQEQRGLAGERLRLDAFKLSHHGSANATTKELLDTVECSHVPRARPTARSSTTPIARRSPG